MAEGRRLRGMWAAEGEADAPRRSIQALLSLAPGRQPAVRREVQGDRPMSTEVWRRLTSHALVAWLLYQGAAPMVPNAPREHRGQSAGRALPAL
jgi:hypothetical protein